MKHPPKATIIPILLLNDKIVMSLSHRNQKLWLVYITICNLDLKTRRSQTHLGTLLLGSIPIIHRRLKNGNNRNQYLKAKIYYLALTTMIQRKFPF